MEGTLTCAWCRNERPANLFTSEQFDGRVVGYTAVASCPHVVCVGCGEQCGCHDGADIMMAVRAPPPHVCMLPAAVQARTDHAQYLRNIALARASWSLLDNFGELLSEDQRRVLMQIELQAAVRAQEKVGAAK